LVRWAGILIPKQKLKKKIIKQTKAYAGGE
jgi:hypothetical protein